MEQCKKKSLNALFWQNDLTQDFTYKKEITEDMNIDNVQYPNLD